MKKNVILCLTLLLFISTATYAQTVAQDWTKTDCDGKTHSLFSDLDNGKVVMIQFDMMNCIYCTKAAYNTDQIYKDYQVSNPGKLIMYSMGYDNNTTCDLMKNWVSTNKFSFSIIEKCPDDVAYYGGMGMPTIVILGGRDHKVFYNKQGYSTSDNAVIKDSINAALVKAGIADVSPVFSGLKLYPNPSSQITNLVYTLSNQAPVSIEVIDLLGQKSLSVLNENQQPGPQQVEINTSLLRDGMYFVRINGETLKLQVSN
jgi:Secretion system C-terminal sorting domain